MDNVAIIGGGPAALSCATWLESFHLDYHIYCPTDCVGGLLRRVNNPLRNFPPTEYDTGSDLAQVIAEQLNPRIGTSSRVDLIRPSGDGWELCGEFGVESYKTVVIATGTRYRLLGIPGEKGEHVSQSATKDGERFAGQKVAVVGGGDAAFENALILSEHGCEVTLFSRSPYRARREFVSRANSTPSIAFAEIGILPTEITAQSEGCDVKDSSGATWSFAGVFIRIGVEATFPKIDDVKTDEGYLVTDHTQRTSLDGIYAIGDVTKTALRSVSTAMGDGARAAKDIFSQREQCSKKS